MKYLKLFNQDAEYQQFKETEDYILPNVSFIQESNSVAYNPYEEVQETRLVCTYNVTNTTSVTQLYQDGSGFTSMEVDGVLQDSLIGDYTFDTVGEHTVKFELTNSTTIGIQAFFECKELTSVVIPNSVTTISLAAFSKCGKLTSVVIPNSVTTIGNLAFISCSGLTEIVCHAPTAPTINNGVFKNVKTGGVLKVPAGSDYSTWMSEDEGYFGYYNWTIEYI